MSGNEPVITEDVCQWLMRIATIKKVNRILQEYVIQDKSLLYTIHIFINLHTYL